MSHRDGGGGTVSTAETLVEFAGVNQQLSEVNADEGFYVVSMAT